MLNSQQLVELKPPKEFGEKNGTEIIFYSNIFERPLKLACFVNYRFTVTETG